MPSTSPSSVSSSCAASATGSSSFSSSTTGVSATVSSSVSSATGTSASTFSSTGSSSNTGRRTREGEGREARRASRVLSSGLICCSSKGLETVEKGMETTDSSSGCSSSVWKTGSGVLTERALGSIWISGYIMRGSACFCTGAGREEARFFLVVLVLGFRDTETGLGVSSMPSMLSDLLEEREEVLVFFFVFSDLVTFFLAVFLGVSLGSALSSSTKDTGGSMVRGGASARTVTGL
mmetsp:Transcript_32394/g.64311  ORF Transcript_32394/g.64311 Transcript_32394/m.64311 type:complete len:236 (-) Transcript_32394:314-1021(-)